MKTQSQIVIEQLLEKGYVRRNWALSKYVSRLGSIINNLIEDGWKFDDRPSKNGKEVMRGRMVKGDYIYYCISIPKHVRTAKNSTTK